jgi:hypothetical protein
MIWLFLIGLLVCLLLKCILQLRKEGVGRLFKEAVPTYGKFGGPNWSDEWREIILYHLDNDNGGVA